MEDNLTIEELEKRWEYVLMATQDSVNKHPGVYHKLKSLAADIVETPLDIKEYLPTAKMLVELLKILDPNEQGSIFNLFTDRVVPSSIWKVSLLRLECKDLLDHLKTFDNWRIETHHLRIIK
ncbi:MAG: hypothetical protein KJ882_10480 [Proteobacteria bacterium]|nr:hypothetical protein [Pseudomonadota bacterium]